jgi:hypothetical protein
LLPAAERKQFEARASADEHKTGKEIARAAADAQGGIGAATKFMRAHFGGAKSDETQRPRSAEV